MTLTINLPPATVELLKAETAASGKDVETFVREAVEGKLARRKRTFAEILKPILDAVEDSGMSEQAVESSSTRNSGRCVLNVVRPRQNHDLGCFRHHNPSTSRDDP